MNNSTFTFIARVLQILPGENTPERPVCTLGRRPYPGAKSPRDPGWKITGNRWSTNRNLLSPQNSHDQKRSRERGSFGLWSLLFRLNLRFPH